MKQFNSILEHINKEEGQTFAYDIKAIEEAFENKNKEKSNIAIKVLSVFGGFMAALAFLGFLFVLGIYDSASAMLVMGILFLAGAIALNKFFDRIIIDTFSISVYGIGLALIIFGMADMSMDEDVITLVVIGIAIISLLIAQTYMLSFLSVVTIAVGVMVLIFSNDSYNLLHAYVFVYTLALASCFLGEGWFLAVNKKLAKLYGPIRIGLVISLLMGLIALGKRDLVPEAHDYIWLSSLPIALCILYVVYDIIGVLGITQTRTKVLIYALSVAVLFPTILAPSIAGAILILLLGFRVNYKTGMVAGIIALVYFVSQYYYDLNFTLLTKSIILFCSGVAFLLFYLFISKKSNP